MNRAQKVLKLAMVTGEMLARSQRRRQEKTASEGATSTLIPQAVDSLVKNERIQPHQATKVAEALKDPAKALELLRDVAKHRNANELAIGSTMPKVASEQPRKMPGATVDFDETPAGQAFANRILRGRS